MTPQRWNRICDRWLVIALIPLIVLVLHYEIGSWERTIFVIAMLIMLGSIGAVIIGAIVTYYEDILNWLKGY